MSRAVRTRRLKRTSTAAGVAVLAAFAVAPASSQAAFSRNATPCSGSIIEAAGASFQQPAHDNLWRTTAYTNYCSQFGGVGASGVSDYPDAGDRSGSGFGRRLMGVRDGDNADGSLSRNRPTRDRLGGTDEPISQQEAAQINQGTDASGDEGLVRIVPVAVGAVVTLVNLPEGCTPGAGGGSGQADSDGRVRFDKPTLDKIWASDDDADTWAEVMPGSTGCEDKQITRVRRRDNSGTTFVYKDYLDRANPSRGWLTTFNTPDTTVWPNLSKNGAAGTPTLIPGDANGGSSLRTKVDQTDGSIGYLELRAARTNFSYEGNPATDNEYFIKAQNGQNQYVDAPTNGPSTAASRGAQCENVTFSNVPGGSSDPDSTLGDWSKVSGVNTGIAGQYGICTLTYLLAFDDSADAYGDTAAEEAQARTVKDYLTAILEQGQSGLRSQDQAPLPGAILTRSAAGVNAIDWCKGGCGGSSGGTTTGGGTTTTTTGGGTAMPVTPADPQPIVTISNLFTIRSVRTTGTDIVVTLRLPGAGRATVIAATTARRRVNRRTRTRRFTYARAGVTVAQAGDVAVRLPRSRRATSELRRAVGRRGSVRVTVRFVPNGGEAREQTFTRAITVRATRPRG